MTATNSVLVGLLIASLVANCAFIRQLWEASKKKRELEHEIDRLRACITEAGRQQVEEALQRKKEVENLELEKVASDKRVAELEAEQLRQNTQKQTFFGNRGSWHKARPTWEAFT